MAMGPEGGAGVGGVTAGIATIAHAGPLGLRTGITWHGFANTSGAIWLLEIGFVTNPREERRLKDSHYRDELARAILAGLVEYKRHWDQRLRAAGEPAGQRAP